MKSNSPAPMSWRRCLAHSTAREMYVAIFVRDVPAARFDVAAVNREACGDLSQSAPHLCARVVALVAVRLAYIHQKAGEAIDVAPERLERDVDLFLMRNGGEVGGFSP